MKDTCWTCRAFVYSGELDVGECLIHEKMVKENGYCNNHQNYGETIEECFFCGMPLDECTCCDDGGES
jgi:hypothetical protein